MTSPQRPPRGSFNDLFVFLALLVVGTLLILVGHISPTGLAAFTAALAGLFAAWRGQRPR